MNTTTKKLLDIDKPMVLNGSGRNFQQHLEPLLCDLYAATGKPAAPDSVRRALNKLNLTRPQLSRLRINDHVMVHVVPFGDWGSAFTSRRAHPARLGVCGFALRNVGVLSNSEVTIKSEGKKEPDNKEKPDYSTIWCASTLNPSRSECASLGEMLPI